MNRYSARELRLRYLIMLAVSGVAGTITALLAGHRLSGSGVSEKGPTFAAVLLGEVVALALLTVSVLVVARRADRDTLELIARHLLWAAFVVAAVPGLAWFVLWLSGGSVQALYGLAAIVVGGLPVLMAHCRRRALPVVLTCCLAAGAAMVAMGVSGKLYLLLPFSLAVAVAWVLVVTLLGYSLRRRTKNVVPSN